MKIYYSDKYCAETGVRAVDGNRPKQVVDGMKRTELNFEIVEPELASLLTFPSNFSPKNLSPTSRLLH